MKKQIISIITTSILATSSICYAERLNTQDFFIKANASANFFQDAKQFDGVKVKAKTAPSFAVGLGYYVLDNLRTDLSIEYYINPTFKKSYTNHEEYGSPKLKQTVKLSTLMLNTNIDVVDIDIVKLFVGAGIGMARHQTKYCITGADLEGDDIDMQNKTKTSNNFAYSLGTGLSIALSEGINAELYYSYKNFGQTTPKKDEDGDNMSKKIHYSSHGVSIGLRVDI
jgi:opacity protein-like surface antigen